MPAPVANVADSGDGSRLADINDPNYSEGYREIRIVTGAEEDPDLEVTGEYNCSASIQGEVTGDGDLYIAIEALNGNGAGECDDVTGEFDIDLEGATGPRDEVETGGFRILFLARGDAEFTVSGWTFAAARVE